MPATQDKPNNILLFRVAGILLLALIACVVPEVGEHRFLLAFLLTFVIAPVALFMEAKFPMEESGWSEPLVDLLAVITLVHLVPHLWYVALVIGLMVALAPSVSANHAAPRYYALLGSILILGMGAAGWLYQIPRWWLTMLAIIAIYPSIVFYAYWINGRANALKQRAQALTTLNQIAGGVAHDFNNILTGVAGHAEHALSLLPSDHPAAESLRDVIAGTDRAGDLSSQLLAFSGRALDRAAPIELAVELKVIVSLFGLSLPDRVELDLHLEEDPLPVTGDRGEMQQVLMNLLLNAVEAIEAPPGLVTITGSRTGQTITIEFKDTGVGIPEENLTQVFEPFFSTKSHSRGLGLASVQRIITQHGGTLVFNSGDQGTRACLELPAANA